MKHSSAGNPSTVTLWTLFRLSYPITTARNAENVEREREVICGESVLRIHSCSVVWGICAMLDSSLMWMVVGGSCRSKLVVLWSWMNWASKGASEVERHEGTHCWRSASGYYQKWIIPPWPCLEQGTGLLRKRKRKKLLSRKTVPINLNAQS